MKRDMELVRKILFEIENKFQPGFGELSELKIEDYDMALIGDHCELLYEAGLIKSYNPKRGGMGNRLLFFTIGNLTNSGYDYLELIRSDKIWKQAAEEIEKNKLPNTIETIGKVAASIVGAFLREYTR